MNCTLQFNTPKPNTESLSLPLSHTHTDSARSRKLQVVIMIKSQSHEDYDYSVTIPLLLGNEEDEGRLLVHYSSSVHGRSVIGKSGDTSFSKTCFNCLNALSGVGILSVPYALASGGWLSLAFLLIIASSTFYTGLLIQRCMDADPTIRSYPDIGERAFGSKGRILVSIIMNTELYMVVTGFLILEGDNLNNLLPNMSFEIGGLIIGGRQSFVIMVGLIILPTIWLNNMSILPYISATGVLASVIILGSIMWMGAFEWNGFKETGTALNWKGIPTAISLYAFCYCAHPVFPTLYISMKNQKEFSKVLLLCFLFCTFTYSTMAIFGYLMFGSGVQSQITLNLPTNKISSKVAIYTTLVNPISKYALMITPIVNAIETRFQSYCNKRKFSNFFIRTALVMSTVLVALLIPFFGYLMSLVGAFLSVTASIILPGLCYLKISGIYRRLGFELVTIGSIVIMGICVAVIGTYTSLIQIVYHL